MKLKLFEQRHTVTKTLSLLNGVQMAQTEEDMRPYRELVDRIELSTDDWCGTEWTETESETHVQHWTEHNSNKLVNQYRIELAGALITRMKKQRRMVCCFFYF